MNEDLVARRRRLLGWGWKVEPISPQVDIGCDVVLAPAGTSARLPEVEGVDALLQDLRVALTTRLGDNLFNTQFGFDGLNALSDETNPILQRERIRLAVVAVLRREPRITRINSVDVKFGDRPSRRLDIQAHFTVTDGGTATVSFNPMWGLHVDS